MAVPEGFEAGLAGGWPCCRGLLADNGLRFTAADERMLPTRCFSRAFTSGSLSSLSDCGVAATPDELSCELPALVVPSYTVG